MNKPAKIIIGVVVVALIVRAIIMGTHKQADQTSVAGTQAQPVKIGAVFAMTGIASSWTEVAKDAAQLAVDEINAAGGINGRQVQLIVADSATDPAKSVSAFQKLTSVDHVDAAIGDVWAFLTNPLVPITATSKTLLVSPTVMDASVEKGSPYFFTLGHQMTGIEPAINKFFDLYPKAKTASLICWANDPWGLAYTAEYEKVAAQRGVKIIMKACVQNDFNPDYRNEAAKAKAAKADVVLFDGLGDRGIAQLRTFGVMSPVIADSNTISGYEIGGTVSTDQLKNAYVIDWHPSDDFVKKFEAKYAKYPVLEAQNSYEAVRSIARALQTNSTDIVAGLKTVKYDSVDGANGIIDFTTGTNNNPNKTPASLYIVHSKDNFEQVK